MKTLVHLVRHGEVHNPEHVWYGRLEGFDLSERGRRQAQALAEFFKDRSLGAVYSSPLTRALSTAGPIAAASGLQVTLEPDIIESINKLEGGPGGYRALRNPRNFRHFINPLRPSWGEPYREIADRMTGAIHRMRQQHAGREVVAVSHMTPVVVARMALEAKVKHPWLTRFACSTASVTTLEFNWETFLAAHYRPVGNGVR